MRIFNSRFLFSTHSSLKTLLEKEIIPLRKESTLLGLYRTYSTPKEAWGKSHCSSQS